MFFFRKKTDLKPRPDHPERVLWRGSFGCRDFPEINFSFHFSYKSRFYSTSQNFTNPVTFIEVFFDYENFSKTN